MKVKKTVCVGTWGHVYWKSGDSQR